MLKAACKLSQKCYAHQSLVFLTHEFSMDTIIIAFKGTTTLKEVLVDATIDQINLGKFGKVHRGFYQYFTDKHRDYLRGFIKDKPSYNNIVFTGHSLGGAIATIASAYFACEFKRNIYCVSFGAPRVGNSTFCKFFKTVVLKSFRFANKGDLVTNLPPAGLYKHVKTKYVVNENLFEIEAHKLVKYCPCL